MAITPAQSRAARALLNLSQADVAKDTSVGQTRLSRFENPDTDFRLSVRSLTELEQFYHSRSIEFTDREGVRRKPIGFIELRGHEGFKEFIYDVYATVKNGGDICVTNVDERQFEYWQGVHAGDYLSKMGAVNGLRFRAIVQKGDTYFTASEYARYRTLDEKYFTGVPTYVYGDKKAEILFDDDTVTVFVIDNTKLADTQRRLFEMAWELADEPI